MTLFPAILTGSKQEAQQQVIWASTLETVRTVHIDVIDGQFVENVTLTPSDLREIDFGELSCDLHLMTEEPLDFVYEAIEHKRNLPLRMVYAQVERMSYQDHFLETVKKQNWQAGIALDLFTPLEEIDSDVWMQLDGLLLMGIDVGWQGQTFHQGVLEKIKRALEIRRQMGRDFEICIDGGIKAGILASLHEVGIEHAVVGSSLWQSEDLQLAFTQLLEVA